MKNLLSFINIEAIKAESESEIKRGKSVWEFIIPTNFTALLLQLWWALAYNNVGNGDSWPVEASKSTRYETDEPIIFNLWDIDWPSSSCHAQVKFISTKEFRVITAWSSFTYSFEECEGGTRILFNGPRAAFAQQQLLPKQILPLLQWQYCEGMWDANDEWHPFNEVKAFYHKVDGDDQFRWKTWMELK